MEKIYFTVTGINHKLGTTKFMERGMAVQLIKDPDNKYDREAIKIMMEGLGHIGYVANSVGTVIGDSYSAGRIYDRIAEKADGEIAYVFPDAAVCVLKDKNQSTVD